MSGFLLDTNFCIYLLRSRANRSVLSTLAAVGPGSVAVSSITNAELFFGAYRSSRVEENLILLADFFGVIRTIPFDRNCEELYGRTRAQLARAGTSIGPNDLLIAATALAHGFTLVTHNTREFSRIPGLALEDWEREMEKR